MVAYRIDAAILRHDTRAKRAQRQAFSRAFLGAAVVIWIPILLKLVITSEPASVIYRVFTASASAWCAGVGLWLLLSSRVRDEAIDVF